MLVDIDGGGGGGLLQDVGRGRAAAAAQSTILLLLLLLRRCDDFQLVRDGADPVLVDFVESFQKLESVASSFHLRIEKLEPLILIFWVG